MRSAKSLKVFEDDPRIERCWWKRRPIRLTTGDEKSLGILPEPIDHPH
jgi:hypothetical protein